MSNKKYRWLPHLENSVPEAEKGRLTSTYYIALEGWRRGLDLEFYRVIEEDNRLKIKHVLSNGNRSHHFSLSMGDKTSDEAFDICDNKELTKKYLSQNNVPVPGGETFGPEVNVRDVVDYGASLGFPLVLKPLNGNQGDGVFSNIQKEKELQEIYEYVHEKLEYDDIMVESYVKGKEFRIVVIGDRILGAMHRRPASIVGNGKHTINELININNIDRDNNPHLTGKLIRKDMEIKSILRKKGYNFKSILDNGERIYLRDKSNLSAGGDSIDVTNLLTPELQEIALNIGRSIPGLNFYGLDMIVDLENNTGTVLEVNARPGIGGHLFPAVGEPRDLAKDIVDYYFPETIDNERSNLFFDFNSIKESLKSRSATSIKVANPPAGKLYSKKYIISGKVQKVGYRKWIAEKAKESNLHGYTNNLKNGKVLVIVAGEKSVVNNFRKVCEAGTDRAKIKKVKEKIYTKPLRIGFGIRNYNSKFKDKNDTIKRLKQKTQELKDNNKELKLENEELKKEIQLIERADKQEAK